MKTRHRKILQKNRDRLRPVRFWLYVIAALVALMVVIGGTTRLTGSGLSITEWKPVTGIVPPFTQSDWQIEFEKYRAIPQYQQVNKWMSLDEFQVIYWWEWSHRALGRVLGVVFLVPFFWFLSRGLIDRALGWKLSSLFLLGGFQGAIGWWMVASGLSERVDVSQYRLAIHLTLACVIFAAIIAGAASLEPWHRDKASLDRMRYGAIAVLVLTFVQFFFGALVAKTNAGLAFNTWPLMDGYFVPPPASLFAMNPLWKNLFENVMTVQFDHRMIAYVLLAVAGWHAFDVGNHARPSTALRAAILFAIATAQLMLGVLTLLWAAPLMLALMHQIGAIILLFAATRHVTRFER
jgi:heme a synthase